MESQQGISATGMPLKDQSEQAVLRQVTATGIFCTVPPSHRFSLYIYLYCNSILPFFLRLAKNYPRLTVVILQRTASMHNLEPKNWILVQHTNSEYISMRMSGQENTG